MLNISVAPQIKASADNPATMISSGSAGANDSVTEDFGRVLEREVSETKNKYEKNDTTTAHEHAGNDVSPKEKHTASTDKDTTSTTDVPADGANSFIQNLLTDAAAMYKTPPSQQAMGAIMNPDAMIAVTALPQGASSLPSNIPLPQDGEQIAHAVIPVVNQLLQQSLNQSTTAATATAAAGNFTTLSDNYWQFLGTADSAAYGKFVPSASGMSNDVLLDNAAPVFKTQEEPLASQSFGLSSTAVTASQNATPQDVKVDAPVGQHRWGGEFAQKVVWLSTQQHQVAEIRLNPAHLGPVEVMLSITQDQATAQFASPHSAVREAIQEALPRLREMMAENGIQLGNVMVGTDSFQQENKQQQSHYAARSSGNMNNAGQEAAGQVQTAAVAVPIRHQGLVNTYA